MLAGLEDAALRGESRALIRALLGGPAGPSPNTLFQALLLVSYERRSGSGLPAPSFMMCDVAESLGDIKMLQRCTEELERMAPSIPTHEAS